MGRRSVSARDVASLAGVSRASVSRCFTPGASISAATRARVLAAAETLGYQVNRLASGLIRNETGLVALIAAEIATPYRAAMIAALTRQLQAAGKLGVLIDSERAEDSVSRALRQAIAYRADAAIILSGMPAAALAETCARNGMRLVLINRDEDRPGSLRIRLDDALAGRQACAQLLAAGCRRLALASSAAATASLVAREDGFCAAARAAGIDLLEVRRGATGYETGLDLGMLLLARPDRPDGIFCTTDLLACGVLDVARWRLGIPVPEALSVIGHDDIAQAGWEGYALATFAQPVEEMARAAVDWLCAPAGPAAERRLAARLVPRASLRRPVAPAPRG
ncbi:LacI family DNA-binding transcriptional regulator [Paracoccus sp. (in: a-proteobacteria)]|uniref:LacI family DNA-binding transcriptional regulator n=1 Tax=Paracoccus sp. TaxID=267 RepID=UPI00321F7F99